MYLHNRGIYIYLFMLYLDIFQSTINLSFLLLLLLFFFFFYFLENFENQSILFYIQIGLAALLSISFTINILLCCLRKSGIKSQQIQTTNEDDNDDVSMKNREITYATVLTSAKHTRMKRESHPEDTLYSGLSCHQQSWKLQMLPYLH